MKFIVKLLVSTFAVMITAYFLSGVTIGNNQFYVGDSEDKREKCTVFIDGRLNAEEAEIYVVTPDKIDEYRKTLFDDSEASPLNCSYKSTTHCSAIIAGLMVSAYNNVVTNHKLNLDYRIVPFSIKYQLPFLNFEIL